MCNIQQKPPKRNKLFEIHITRVGRGCKRVDIAMVLDDKTERRLCHIALALIGLLLLLLRAPGATELIKAMLE